LIHSALVLCSEQAKLFHFVLLLLFLILEAGDQTLVLAHAKPHFDLLIYLISSIKSYFYIYECRFKI
jgi:hypothetical protein